MTADSRPPSTPCARLLQRKLMTGDCAKWRTVLRLQPDTICVWGDEARLREHIAAHHAAGADHVCIQALRPDGEMGPDERALELLAPRRG